MESETFSFVWKIGINVGCLSGASLEAVSEIFQSKIDYGSGPGGHYRPLFRRKLFISRPLNRFFFPYFAPPGGARSGTSTAVGASLHS